MADPVTWITIISAVVGVAGTAYSAYSSYEKGEAEEEAYDEQAAAAGAEAKAKREQAAREEEIHREKLKRLMGTQRAVFGAAGVDISSGTPLSILLETAEEGEREAEYIRYGGNVEAVRSEQQARLYSLYGSQASKIGTMGATSTFLTGLGSAGMNYSKMVNTPSGSSSTSIKA